MPTLSVTALRLIAPAAVIGVLSMLVLPLPPVILDMLFTFNIALALVVLLVTIYSYSPLDFSVFPTILLVATVFRLALNIASTRVILMNGHNGTDAAGSVIQAFGDFVAGGNYAVGLVVFAILIIINFVVITKGAGRVSEVTARFTLDAMPGKQMAIDADLNAGLIEPEEARQRRDQIGREADFYGAMDGASKFVRGDAIAGVLILVINIIGGLVIGMLQYDMALDEAVQRYTLLTIGDGLVAQVPSIALASATAIIITRVSKSQAMGSQIFEQMVAQPRPLFVAASVIGFLGLFPAMPNAVFLILAAGIAAIAYALQNTTAEGDGTEPQQTDTPAESEVGSQEIGAEAIGSVDIIGLEVGYRLIPLVDRDQGGQLMDRVKGVRSKLSGELGFLVQSVHIRDNLELQPDGYRISINGVHTGTGNAQPDRELAINPGQVAGQLEGTATKDPAFGMDAVWITPSQREHAQSLGYTVVDASTVIATHLSQQIQAHAHELLSHEATQQLIDRLKESLPRLADNLTPSTVSLATVAKVLQNLLAEGIPIRDFRRIAETLVEHGARTQDPAQLTAAVREALGRFIVQHINGSEQEVSLITFDPSVERMLGQSLGSGNEGSGIGLEPGLAERIQKSLRETVDRLQVQDRAPILVVPPEIRMALARWLKSLVSGLHVLSYNEIPDDRQIRIVATIGSDEGGSQTASQGSSAG